MVLGLYFMPSNQKIIHNERLKLLKQRIKIMLEQKINRLTCFKNKLRKKQ